MTAAAVVDEARVAAALARMTGVPDTLAARAKVAETLARVDQFTAIRPPCPPFCDHGCRGVGDFGDAVLHVSAAVEVPTTGEFLDRPIGVARIEVSRHDSLDEASETLIELDIDGAETVLGTDARFTPEQARRLAAELLNAADAADPPAMGETIVPVVDIRLGDKIGRPSSACATADEALQRAEHLREQAFTLAGEGGLILPVTQVRIGDLIPVGDGWLPVYCVDLDEPSGYAKLFTTVDRENYPEIDGDEQAQEFGLDASVRVRRAEVAG